MATAGRVPGWADGAGLVHVTISNEDMADVGHDEVEAVIDVVRTTKGGDVTAVFKEYEPGYWTVSLRSTEHIDAAAVAGFMGGGGHLRAAGYSYAGDRDGVLGALIGASEAAAATIGKAGA